MQTQKLQSEKYLRHPHFASDVFVEKTVVPILRFFPHCVSWTYLHSLEVKNYQLSKSSGGYLELTSYQLGPNWTESGYIRLKVLRYEIFQSKFWSDNHVVKLRLLHVQKVIVAFSVKVKIRRWSLPRQQSSACYPPSTWPHRSSSPLHIIIIITIDNGTCNMWYSYIRCSPRLSLPSTSGQAWKDRC